MKTYTYSHFRAAGYPARAALQCAKDCAAFARLESAGLVQIEAKPEEENYFDVYGEPEGYVDGNGHRVSAEQERKEIADLIDREGCWVVVSRYRPDTESEWERADSVGMCVYYDPLNPLENCYVTDLMRAAVDAVEASTFAPAL